MAPFESLGKVSYLPSIVTLAVSSTVYEIARYWSKIRDFFHSPLHSLGGPRRNIAIMFGTAITTVVWLLDGVKSLMIC